MQGKCWLFATVMILFVLRCDGWGHADVQPGMTITTDNIAQAEELLTPGTRWMVERGMPMQIIATTKVQWPTAYRDATEKYAKQVKLAADGRDISDYVAGCPFPTIDVTDPLAGYRIMWNYEQKPYDNFGTDLVSEVINSKGETARTFTSRWRRLVWTGRLYLDPKPTVPHTPLIRFTDLILIQASFAASGSGRMAIAKFHPPRRPG